MLHEMIPAPAQNQKSFYGKARYYFTKDGTAVLVSYETPVCACKDGKMYRLRSGYSATTMRHVCAFSWQFVGDGMNKKQWDALPYATLDYSREIHGYELVA